MTELRNVEADARRFRLRVFVLGVVVLLAFLLIVLHSKHLHIGLAPINITFKRLPDGLGPLLPMEYKGEKIDFDDPAEDAVFGRGKIEDFTWKANLDMATCTECGRCQSQCPAWNTGKPLSPKLLIMSLRDHGMTKAPYLLAGGSTDMGGEEVGLLDADGKPDQAKLEAIPAAARAEAARKLVGESKGADRKSVV